ncbi:MAG: PaaI family thioesterase [Proteobacteria bacterium]|nr:PaaI family thioesterase [Pseudomonadota bacterium]MCP4922136.1 PaaI family thioesterase [Pseudomonadota bacterium]
MRSFWEIPDEVDAEWTARRRLSALLRELNQRCIDSEQGLEQAAVLVEQALALVPPGRTSRQAYADGSYVTVPAKYPDRGAMMGLCNPIAPPLLAKTEGDITTCVVALDERYVGAPGMAHGGIVAACFDQICGHAIVMGGEGALTTELTIRYHRPVPLHTEVTFSVQVTGRKRRKLTIEGKCVRDGERLADCHGVFVAIDPEMARRVIPSGELP